MFKVEFGVFRGSDSETVSSALVSDTDIMIALDASGISKEKVNTAVESFKELFKVTPPKTLIDFKQLLDRELSSLGSDDDISYAAGLVVGEILYLVVSGGGKVMAGRDGVVGPIIEGNTTASGKIHPHDTFLFLSKNFLEISKEIDLTTYIGSEQAISSVDELHEKLNEEKSAGAVGLFTLFLHGQEEAVVQSLPMTEEVSRTVVTGPSFIEKIKIRGENYSSKKKLTFVVVFILSLVLIWSVGFGVKRRNDEAAKKKIQIASETISAKIDEAQNVAPLNLSRATILAGEAKETLDALKKELGDSHKSETDALSTKISTVQNKITNRQDKKYEEFYDLSLIEKNGQAQNMALIDDNLVLINSKSGKIYTLSLPKKSNEVLKKSDLVGATAGSFYNDVYSALIPSKGIITVDSEGKVKKVIDKEGWNNPRDYTIFNGNIYVLDSGAGDVHKYLVAEDGYSKKTSYFGSGQGGLIKGALGIAIDSSVYILQSDSVLKYTSGEKTDFRITLPDSADVSFTRFFTNDKVDRVYLLDSRHGKIIVVSKDGTYEKQIESQIFVKATNFVVFENKIILLSGNKLYSVGL
ncbi:hypothetical protein A3D80_04045 [Candidatus Roizmanbacteria bacterium RIFCSPHIGHO2_02_FULL_40_13b]|uniref:PPM-type phosphatase domain-containing protein n=1 Tax=Candidatus Roizmanbacteria bacterium RIFCSPHIGHO2_01_FULL_39_24 TaxID=1802032 RepID=A0A1F7GKX4_9BACT|nr:MAG: hypothetical protein A2799_00380 [Candidatus Roizmanbacteria bacterium RIFCSPHIGHO2_01_FULL_39_24]OGK27964.1 MAG: hypothetical protein A3D80_04045 [Candidatus Roizmanbacteria bacterium RIFCSPHIGHO2_02_FULL_40_13b]OGK49244.1 MAG: hypothetical protein A3A56_04590 [Candidatus Roizmanbacteria bacterium RIFCSPLOWO2_01_FULL_40_32]